MLVYKYLPEYNLFIGKNGKVFSPIRNKFIKLHKTRDGYLRFNIGRKPNYYSFLLHRLLAQTFIENPDNKAEVGHINQDRLDNRIENLRWVTHKENCNNRSYKLGVTVCEHLITGGTIIYDSLNQVPNVAKSGLANKIKETNQYRGSVIYKNRVFEFERNEI